MKNELSPEEYRDTRSRVYDLLGELSEDLQPTAIELICMAGRNGTARGYYFEKDSEQYLSTQSQTTTSDVNKLLEIRSELHKRLEVEGMEAAKEFLLVGPMMKEAKNKDELKRKVEEAKRKASGK